MIHTRFEEVGLNNVNDIELVMPYPVRVGDQVELDDSGISFTVKSVTWLVDPVMVDKTGAHLTTLVVRIQ